jgi:hypothetical protein
LADIASEICASIAAQETKCKVCDFSISVFGLKPKKRSGSDCKSFDDDPDYSPHQSTMVQFPKMMWFHADPDPQTFVKKPKY